MTGFIRTAKRISTLLGLGINGRQVSAVLVLLALLMPITAPIPAWAYELNLAPAVDDGLRLTAPSPSLATSIIDFTTDLFNGIAAFVSPSLKDTKDVKKGNEAEAKALASRVAKIKTQLPEDLNLQVGQSVALSALPLDAKNKVVNGVGSYWESGNDEILKIQDDQVFARKEGIAELHVKSGNASKTLKIKVVKGENISTSFPYRAAPLPDDDDEFRSSFTLENNLGSPSGQVEAQAPNQPVAFRGRFVERTGSSNFNFDVPVASLPGRGIDAGISLSYNSRVWNYWQNPIAPQLSRYRYNIDADWLAPGFKLTLGNVRYQNYYNASLMSPDGTRHQLSFLSGDDYARTYESSDGTFIRLYITSTGGSVNNTAVVKYPDGSVYTCTSFATSGGHYSFFPTKITDKNGNTIQIAYRQNDTSGRIWYIRDTLNRYTNFHYDSGNKLVALTVPGFDSASERQTIRFYYETMNFDTTTARFQNVNHTMPSSADMLKYVYFPGTNTGHKYEYSPAWGMIYKISDLRGMQISESVSNPNSLTQTGTVTSEGQIAATTEYNYPLTLGTPLTDVPKYTTRTDDWVGRTTASAPVTSYQVEKDEVNQRTVSKITSPDGTITETWAKIDPYQWDDGLVTDTFTKTLINVQMQTYKTWAHTKLFWGNQTGASGRQNSRILKIEQTNDADQTRATTFEYDSYNNQTLIKEHDFAAPNALGTELRKTEFTYETGAGWINNRLVGLPNLVKTTVNGTVVSKSVFEYDNNGGAAASNLVARTDIDPQTHDSRFNWSNGSNYDVATDFRGNPTKVTAFSDATLTSDSNAAITAMKYDIVGNLVESGASCCKRKVWDYSKTNEYAYPVSETRGDAGQLTMSMTYDRNTGLVKTATDENTQTSTVTYNPNNLRVIRTDSPNGAWTTTEYNDSTYPYHVKSTASLDATRSVSTWSFANGRGQTFRSREQTALGYLSKDIEFDIMGRAEKSFNPYTVTNLTDGLPTGIKFTVTTQRDGLERALSVVLPDLTTVSATYSGLVATVTDQAGKSRRKTLDTLGRIIRVDEPNANGLLDVGGVPVQPTNYEYDGNGNLTKVTQTAGSTTQERLFKYDALSRLIAEKQVEATADLDSNGVKVSSGGLWTGVYKYDNQSLLLEGTNARGVKTAFTYDGLNRTRTATYTGETGYQTPTVTYTYDEEKANYYNKGRLTKVQTAANVNQGTPETIHVFDFDRTGHTAKHTQSIGNQTYQLQYGYNLVGQLVSETYPSGRVITATVDNYGITQTIADAQRTYLNGVMFDSRGTLSQMNFGNGTSETYLQNDRFQVTSQSLLKGTYVLQKYDYSYGTVDLDNGNVDSTKNNGRLAKIEASIGANKQWSQRFGYDELDRLKEAREYKQGDNAHLTYKQRFDFDRFGNLYRKSANNSAAGQENPLAYTVIEDSDISKSTNRFTSNTSYDEVGNVVADSKFRSMGFSYDANGRMVKATKANQPDAWTVYDGLGNRVATKINDVWQYTIYDAFGHLVAEYGLSSSSSSGGVKYILQDLQGSPRTVTSNTGFIVARTDNTSFGEEIGAGVGLRTYSQGYSGTLPTRHGYGSTEKDDATGLNHAWFRKNETRAGRWTSPDPYKGSMSVQDPQSFNRYSYVSNDPLNHVDPSGLYEGCIHKAMTALLALWADLGAVVADKLGYYAGDEPGGADSPEFAADTKANWDKCRKGKGPSVAIHFPSAEQLQANINAYPGYLALGTEAGYQQAGHMIHSIEDSLGAHLEYTNDHCQGHAVPALYLGDVHATDRIIGDDRFISAANRVFQVMKNDPEKRLTNGQINELVDFINHQCGKKYPLDVRHVPEAGGTINIRGGGGRGGGHGGGGGGGSRYDNSRQFDWLEWYYGRRAPTINL